MVKEQLHNLKQTINSFQCRGVISGTKSQKFYKDKLGSNQDGISVNFGVNIADKKSVFMTLTGYPRKEVYYYKKGENGAKGTTKAVAWKDRKKSPGEGYRLIGVSMSTGKDADGNNINSTFTEYDAVNYLHENLQDGDSVFIRGTIEFRSWTDKNGQIVKRINLVPNQISYTKKPIDFEAEDFTEMCEFENTLVFSSVDPETDENDKKTGRFVLSGYSVGYNTVENVSFVIDEAHEKLAKNLHKAMKPGYAIKTYGRVNVIIDTTMVEDDSDGWGESSPMERLNAPVRREYVVYRAEPSSIEKEDYSEDAINEALRKIKAAKTAKANFGEKPNINVTVDDDDWSTDDEDDDSPWD